MTKQHRLDLLVWLALVATAVIEVALTNLPLPPPTRPILMLPAVLMAVLVALGYMRLLAAPQLAKAFAIAGLFWLTVLLSLAMTDPLTRTIYPVVQ